MMNKKIKLFHLTGSLSIGGAQRLLLGLMQQLNQEDFETHLYSFSKYREVSFLPDFEAISGIHLTVKSSNSFHPRTLLTILNYIRQHKPDIIQTHMIDADILGRIAGKLARVPVIATLQNDPQNYDSHRWERRFLARFTARFMTTHSVAVSNHIRDLFVQRWKIHPDKISTIYNAVALDKYQHIPIDSSTNDDANGLTITNIASLSPQKAQRLLLEAAKIVLEKHPETRFMIVGQGALEQELKTQAAQMGLTEQVLFTGVRRDIPEILAQTDIFTLSSLWEGLPLAAIEAMAAGRPVVLTDVGGNKELIGHGQHGLIVPANNVPALASAFETLIEDREMRLRLAQAGRKYVSQIFGIRTITNQYEALYRRLLQKTLSQK